MDYEICLSKNNKIKICRNKSNLEKLKSKEKQLKGLHELNSYSFDFITYFTNIQGLQIYLANKSILKLAIKILLRSDPHEQLLSYNTVHEFNEGQFHLSILTIKNIHLIHHQVFPLFYLIHENNGNKEVHFDFWNNFVIKQLGSYEIPITVSKDEKIMNSVLKCLENSKSKLFFCSNKIVRDVHVNSFYLNDCPNDSEIKFQSKDYKVGNFKTGIENLVSSETIRDYEELLAEFKPFWSQRYLNYFENYVGPLILSNLLRKKPSNLRLNLSTDKAYDLEPFITNCDNGFSLNDLILKLYRSSCEFIIKFNKDYLDDKVKEKYSKFSNKPIIESKYIDYFDQNKWKNNLSCLTYFGKPSIFKLFHFQIADLAIKNNLIYKDELKNVFLVKSPFNEIVNTVYDDNGQTSCTCSLSNICFHKIAAKYISEL